MVDVLTNDDLSDLMFLMLGSCFERDFFNEEVRMDGDCFDGMSFSSTVLENLTLLLDGSETSLL